MKNLAIAIAAALSIVSNAAIAENPAPLTLALNNQVVEQWIDNSTEEAINTETLNNDLNLVITESIEKISIELGEQLEAKFAKEIEYAM